MIRTEGATAACEQLDAIAEAITQNMTAAIVSEAAALQAEARRRCPVDTGKLRDSICVQIQTQGADVAVVVGSGLDYAKHVELGTLSAPPKPYLAPACRARRGALIERIQQAVRRALGKARP